MRTAAARLTPSSSVITASGSGGGTGGPTAIAARTPPRCCPDVADESPSLSVLASRLPPDRDGAPAAALLDTMAASSPGIAAMPAARSPQYLNSRASSSLSGGGCSSSDSLAPRPRRSATGGKRAATSPTLCCCCFPEAATLPAPRLPDEPSVTRNLTRNSALRSGRGDKQEDKQKGEKSHSKQGGCTWGEPAFQRSTACMGMYRST